MLLAEIVAVTDEVAKTRSRTAKVVLLAEVIGHLDPQEISTAVGFLAGEPRQGKIGVGWARLSGLDIQHSRRPSLTVDDLDLALTRIEETIGPRSGTGREQILTDLLGRATAAEADFIRRLLVGELRQGALRALVAEAVARAAGVPVDSVRRALMLSGDLGKTAALAFSRGQSGLASIGLEVLRPVLPMLASTADDVADALAGLELSSVEWKLDGIRIQVHRKGTKVRVFTRNLNDITDRMPEVVALARSFQVKSVVLDGEAISTGSYFFDCLHLDGRDLIDLPLAERLDLLEKVAAKHRIPSVVTDDSDEAQRLMDSSLEAGHEGVIVKAMASTYQAGRRGKAWRKVKPALTLDLLILAAEWGHGRRRGWLSNLHLGARDPSGGFVMVGKTFKGLTDEMLRWQTDRLCDLKTEERGITVYVRPEIVVEIELDGALVSPRYPGGVGLRFARVKQYRPDKDPSEADTIDAVRSLLDRGPSRKG